MDDIYANMDSLVQNRMQLLHQVLNHDLADVGPVQDFVTRYLTEHGREVIRTAGGCLFSPGTRPDRVVLVAHADTVWDHRYRGTPIGTKPEIEEVGGVLRSSGPFGIGADDRAGVAAILLLADLGHSVLITDREEIGMVGSRELRYSGDKVYEDIQGHSFVVQCDRQGVTDFKCYDVGSRAFRTYVGKSTGLVEPNRHSFTDICSVCREITGVNVSIGYYNEHSRHECLVISEWLHMVGVLMEWLAGPTPRFKLPKAKYPRPFTSRPTVPIASIAL